MSINVRDGCCSKYLYDWPRVMLKEHSLIDLTHVIGNCQQMTLFHWFILTHIALIEISLHSQFFWRRNNLACEKNEEFERRLGSTFYSFKSCHVSHLMTDSLFNYRMMLRQDTQNEAFWHCYYTCPFIKGDLFRPRTYGLSTHCKTATLRAILPESQRSMPEEH